MRDRRVRVPIRVVRRERVLDEKPEPQEPVSVQEATPPVVECAETPAPPQPAPQDEAQPQSPPEEDEVEVWRDRALRLEAEMDNFRKRQRRLAENRIAAERERLLRSFLAVADDMARALAADGSDAADIRAGVDLTLNNLMQLLNREGVEQVAAEGEFFDPNWHEAVGTTPHDVSGVAPQHVAEVLSPGYRLGERLLRPARVIVAQ